MGSQFPISNPNQEDIKKLKLEIKDLKQDMKLFKRTSLFFGIIYAVTMLLIGASAVLEYLVDTGKIVP